MVLFGACCLDFFLGVGVRADSVSDSLSSSVALFISKRVLRLLQLLHILLFLLAVFLPGFWYFLHHSIPICPIHSRSMCWLLLGTLSYELGEWFSQFVVLPVLYFAQAFTSCVEHVWSLFDLDVCVRNLSLPRHSRCWFQELGPPPSHSVAAIGFVSPFPWRMPFRRCSEARSVLPVPDL